MSNLRGSPGRSYRGPAAAIAAVIFFALVLLVLHSGAKSSAPPAGRKGTPGATTSASTGSSASSGSSSSAGAAAAANGAAGDAAAAGGPQLSNVPAQGAQLPNTGAPFPSWLGFLPLALAAALILKLRQRAAMAETIGIVEREERPEVIELPLSLEEVEVARAGERWFDPYYDAEEDHIDDFAFEPSALYTGQRRP
ncbi:MAG TPA: hypothetical protein VFW71_06855 [Actinomycetota bacterium]|nr:hypothetical protein [Actinomycetota bacterium]